MSFKKKVTMIKIVGIILLIVGCVNTNEKNNVLGNWKSIETKDGPKFYTELFIDEETFNVFSEEANDIVFSSYYRLTNNEILILKDDKKNIELSFTYVISGKNLIISGDEMSTKYIRISQDKTMDDYISGIMTKAEYIDEFNKRKLTAVDD